MALRGATVEQKIWNYFKDKGLNDYGCAGLMGNLYAESALNSKNLQNSFEKKLKYTDEIYTKAVDNGQYKNFVRDSAGYGLAVAIPLVVKLVEYVQKSIKEKNWNKLLDLVMKLMSEAETKFETGADKKEWVIAMVKASADTINYDIDIDAVGELIDSLCNMANVVNAPAEKVEK